MSVELLQTLSLVSYVVAGIIALIAVALFFLLDIKKVIGDVTGSTERKAINSIRQQNATSGERLYKPTPENAAKGRFTDEIAPRGESLPKTENRQPFAEENYRTTALTTASEGTSVLDPALNETTVLSGTAASNETTVLSGTAASNETTVLSGTAASNETTVLSGTAASNETTVLSGAVASNETTVLSGTAVPNETTVLSGAAPSDETAILNEPAAVTEVLDPDTLMGETAVLSTTNDIAYPNPAATNGPNPSDFKLEVEVGFADTSEIIE